MKKIALAFLCLGMLAVAVMTTDEAQARGGCPPGYFWDGPYGCMPYGPPPPPPAYYPYYPPGCPPGTVWSYGACRAVMAPPPPPPPRYGITIDVPPIIIR